MSEEKEAEQEPSIEEILDSIRQIISDDDEEEAAAGPEADAAPVSEPEPEPEPAAVEPELEPAVEVEPEPAVEPEPEPVVEPEPAVSDPEPVEDDLGPDPLAEEDDVLELTEKIDESMDIEFQEHIEEPESEPEEPEPEEPELDAPVPEPEPDASLDDTPPMDYVFVEDDDFELDDLGDEGNIFTEKAEAAALGAFKHLAAKTAIDRVGGLTIEDIVRDEMRPMLREWLDHNLPKLVERLVQEELDRIARRALDDD